MTDKWPPHLGPKRAFQQRKRKESKALLKTLGEFRFGTAYIPRYDCFLRASEALKALHLECKDWWKNA